MSLDIIKQYNKISKWFYDARSRELNELKYINKVLNNSSNNIKILDIGCGMGEPIGKYIIDKEYDYLGIDASINLINLAKKNISESHFELGDMRNLKLKDKFDFIICWNSMFHLTQNKQRSFLNYILNFINTNGFFLFTCGPAEGEVYSNNGGEELFHASLSKEEYINILDNNGFNIIEFNIEDKECFNSSVGLFQKRK